MIRTILALMLIAAVVAAAVFFADHPGQVEIVWFGRQIDTSVGLLVAAVAAVALSVAGLVLLFSALRRMPRNWRRCGEARRRRSAETALARGLVALAAGQADEARNHARRVSTLIGEVPVGLLLAAEAAQRQGDAAAARQAYAALLDNRETEFLGLRGLIGQALRNGDDRVALQLSERARRLRPDARWVVDSLLMLQARAGDWEGARTTLTAATRRGALPAATIRRPRGVILYELSRDAERVGDLKRAAALAGKASALVPDLPGPVHDRARWLIALGRSRAAVKTIERAWRTAPHPELARLYLEIDGSAGFLARAATLQRLAKENPDAVESHVAIGEAALTAQLWGEARRHLTIAAAEAPPPGPSRQLCLLLARLEESPDGNPATARKWLDRAISAPGDSRFICDTCGAERLEWQSLCANCGELATLRWRLPGAATWQVGASTNRALIPLILPAHDAAPGPSSGSAHDPAAPNGLAATTQSDNNPARAGAGNAPIAQR